MNKVIDPPDSTAPDRELMAVRPGDPAPYVPPPSKAPPKEITELRLSDPLYWLLLGWRDLMAAKGIGLFYGSCFLSMAMVLGAVFRSKPEYAMSIASGCLLVGPFLATRVRQFSTSESAHPQWNQSLKGVIWNSCGGTF